MLLGSQRNSHESVCHTKPELLFVFLPPTCLQPNKSSRKLGKQRDLVICFFADSTRLRTVQDCEAVGANPTSARADLNAAGVRQWKKATRHAMSKQCTHLHRAVVEMEFTSLQPEGSPKKTIPHLKRGFPCITEVGINSLIPQPGLRSGSGISSKLWAGNFIFNSCQTHSLGVGCLVAAVACRDPCHQIRTEILHVAPVCAFWKEPGCAFFRDPPKIIWFSLWFPFKPKAKHRVQIKQRGRPVDAFGSVGHIFASKWLARAHAKRRDPATRGGIWKHLRRTPGRWVPLLPKPHKSSKRRHP